MIRRPRIITGGATSDSVIMWALSVSSCVGLLLTTSAVYAEAFAGFAKGNPVYVVRGDRVCEPLKVAADSSVRGENTCIARSTKQIANLHVRRPLPERGASARFTARAQAAVLTVQGPRGLIVRWHAPTAIDRVDALYWAPSHRLIAVEIEVRRLGRLHRQVVGFQLAPTAPVAKASATKATAAPKPSKALARRLRYAKRLSTRRQHRAAIQAFHKVHELDPAHAEAHYRIARHYAWLRKPAQSVTSLQALATVGSPAAHEWLIEARFDKAFHKMRARRDFRSALGLDSVKRPKSAYERLVGHGGKWEQPAVVCENAGVSISLRRLVKTFRMMVTSRCRGHTDRLPLSGTWATTGATGLILSFGGRGAQEPVRCDLRACDGEDCLRCVIDRDLTATLRSVRR